MVVISVEQVTADIGINCQKMNLRHTRVCTRCGRGGVTGGDSTVLIVSQILLSIGGPAGVAGAAAVSCCLAVRAAVWVAEAAL